MQEPDPPPPAAEAPPDLAALLTRIQEHLAAAYETARRALALRAEAQAERDARRSPPAACDDARGLTSEQATGA